MVRCDLTISHSPGEGSGQFFKGKKYSGKAILRNRNPDIEDIARGLLERDAVYHGLKLVVVGYGFEVGKGGTPFTALPAPSPVILR